jgi:hypothetical protein
VLRAAPLWIGLANDHVFPTLDPVVGQEPGTLALVSKQPAHDLLIVLGVNRIGEGLSRNGLVRAQH